MSKRLRIVLVSISCGLLLYAVAGAVLGRSAASNDKSYRDLGVYSEVLSRIQQDYVTQPNLHKVTNGAIRGLLEALDPNSTYFTPEEYQDYQQNPDAGPAKVGLFLSKRMGYTTIVSVLPGSPADKAGIKPGDLLDGVKDTPTRELSVVQLSRMLAGDPGTTVEVSIIRTTGGEPEKMTLTREILHGPPVQAKMVDRDTAYLKVATFAQGTAEQVSSKIKDLTAQGAQKIVLDLRDCAGGEPEEGEKTANLFLDQGLITYLSGQRFPRQDVNAKPSGQITKLPVAVLINQSTAGPAEIVAAAILDNKRGDVVGVRSFGEGVYQKLIPVGDGSALLLSVAKYYTPDGKAIIDSGVTPNVVQASTNDQAGLGVSEQPEHFGGKDDLQLQKALDILKQKSPLSKAA
jgi:carboxyl-terminal processing protease